MMLLWGAFQYSTRRPRRGHVDLAPGGRQMRGWPPHWRGRWPVQGELARVAPVEGASRWRGGRYPGREAGIPIRGEPMLGSQVPTDHRRPPRSHKKRQAVPGHVGIMTVHWQQAA
jgi:hypothetical protein